MLTNVVFADTTLNLTSENPVESIMSNGSGTIEFSIEGQFNEDSEPLVNPTIKVVGENLFDKNNVLNGYRFNNGELYYSEKHRMSDYIPVKENTNYYRNIKYNDCRDNYVVYDKDKNKLLVLNNPTSYTNLLPMPAGARFIRVVATKDDLNKYHLIEGSIAPTEFKPYIQINIHL